MKTKQVFSVMAAALVLTLAFIGAGAAFTGCSALSEEDASDPNNPEGGGGGGGGGGGLAGGNSYTVTFNSRDGSYVPPQTVTHGNTVKVPTTPTKDGNILGGWYKEAALTNRWVFATDTVTGDITLYAKWTEAVTGLSFSNGSDLQSGGSAIDLIKAAAGGTDPIAIIIAPPSQSETVQLMSGTDLGVNGLVLSTVPYKLDAESGYITDGHDNWGGGSGASPASSPANVTIDGGKRVVDLTGSATGNPLITVGAGVTLTLQNITFKGLNPADDSGAKNSAPLIRVVGGTLILEDKAVISDNKGEGHVWRSGGGVQINTGNLIMNGGTISNNHSLNGGGGVYVRHVGEFTMRGGDISNNTTSEEFSGGGVLVNGANARFTMSGGDISNNINNCMYGDGDGGGGGVGVSGGSEFIMSGGTISHNSSIDTGIGYSTLFQGGGVGVNEGTFTMTGGVISGNTVTTSYEAGNFAQGGGVSVGSGSTFTKTGGGIIYGGETSTADSLRNIVGTRVDGVVTPTANDKGHAVYVSETRKRETTVGAGVNLDSGNSTNWSD